MHQMQSHTKIYVAHDQCQLDILVVDSSRASPCTADEFEKATTT